MENEENEELTKDIEDNELEDEIDEDKEPEITDDDVKEGEPVDLDEAIDNSDTIVAKAKIAAIPQKKKKSGGESSDKHPLSKFGSIRKAFILDNIRVIEYGDLAELIDVKDQELKAAVEKAGIKLPIDRARKWADLDVGTYRSLADCARCPVQLNHVSFYVGLKKCDKCLEKNIKLWIEKKIPIEFPFSR